jgi:hypothetical protein
LTWDGTGVRVALAWVGAVDVEVPAR